MTVTIAVLALASLEGTIQVRAVSTCTILPKEDDASAQNTKQFKIIKNAKNGRTKMARKFDAKNGAKILAGK